MSVVLNHPIYGYLLWQLQETDVLTSGNAAYLPGSVKAGKMIAQTEAKLNKLLEAFREEEQNNSHRDKNFFPT